MGFILRGPVLEGGRNTEGKTPEYPTALVAQNHR
jgi:hypothetical protein